MAAVATALNLGGIGGATPRGGAQTWRHVTRAREEEA